MDTRIAQQGGWEDEDGLQAAGVGVIEPLLGRGKVGASVGAQASAEARVHVVLAGDDAAANNTVAAWDVAMEVLDIRVGTFKILH